jgi:hypothetical protein
MEVGEVIFFRDGLRWKSRHKRRTAALDELDQAPISRTTAFFRKLNVNQFTLASIQT